MKATVNGIEVEGTMDEIRALLHGTVSFSKAKSVSAGTKEYVPMDETLLLRFRADYDIAVQSIKKTGGYDGYQAFCNACGLWNSAAKWLNRTGSTTVQNIAKVQSYYDKCDAAKPKKAKKAMAV